MSSTIAIVAMPRQRTHPNALILLILALLVLASCSEDPTSEEHLNKAKGFMSEADFPSATIELQNALQLDENLAEARWLLGKIQLDDADILAAENSLQRARDLGWRDDDVLPALARTLLAQGEVEDVLSLEYKELNPSSMAKLYAMQAKAALINGQPEKARALVDLALDKDPQSVDVKLAEVSVVASEGDLEAGLRLAEDIILNSPSSGEAWWLKGQILLETGELEAAAAAFDQSVALKSIAYTDRITRALINLKLRNYDAAQVDATELLTLSPMSPVPNYIQGLLYFEKEQYLDAITALTLAEPVAKQFPLTFYFLSAAYLNRFYSEKDLSLAARFADQFVTMVPGSIQGRKLLAAISVLQNKVRRAQDVLEPVLDFDPDDAVALNVMANAMLMDDKADLGLALYARIAALQPEWKFVPLRREARILNPNGAVEPSSAVAVKNTDDNFPQPDILQILQHLAKQDFPAAIAAAESYQFRDLQSLSPYRVLSAVYLAAGQPSKAKEVLEKLRKRAPTDSIANHTLARLALNAKDTKTARRYYQATLEQYPDDLRILLQLALLEGGEGNNQAMIEILKHSIATHPEALEPRLMLADYELRSGSPDKVAPQFAQLPALLRKSPRALEKIGEAQLAQQQNTAAIETFQQLVEAHPDVAQYRYLLAMAVSTTGDIEKTKQELVAAISRDANHVPSLIVLATIANRENKHEPFNEYLATLAELAPEKPVVLHLQSLSAEAAGDPKVALAFSQQAFTLSPSAQTLLALTRHRNATGDVATAGNALQAWLTIHPTDIPVRMALAEQLILQKKPSAAEAQYRNVLKNDPNNIVALNNLAWSIRTKNPQKSLEYMHRAATIAPDFPDILDTLAVIESLNGNHDAAILSIRRALVGAPNDLSMRYHQAEIEANMGATDEAISSLEELVAQDADEFAERAEAKKLLASLKNIAN
ncbi:MAG: PEP-CTERM system TPR-repeat protein PrsT [Halioglobus sp.]|nr:PEP-CTERM system TPR-repeat protein PrsT [Halioglobus sp.]